MLTPRLKQCITDNPKKLGNLIDLVNLPSTLRDLTGLSQTSRLGCFMRVSSYIKTNNLQDPNNKNVVICDEKLKTILLGNTRVILAELPAVRRRSAPFYNLRTFSSHSKPEDSVPAKEEREDNGEDAADATKSKSTAAASESPDDLSDDDLSVEDLLKLVSEKDQLLDAKHKELQDTKEKVLRTYAEMENVMARTRREADNSKKFAIQNFAKNLLDVADNLGRASSVVKESFAKIDQSKDAAGAVPLLKTLLEGVDMTDKQLGEVFKKFGLEKYDPLDEPFDPHRHNAVFQIPDASKPSGTVAVVLKSGYMLYDRVIRPAEVGVIQAVESNEAEQGSEA